MRIKKFSFPTFLLFIVVVVVVENMIELEQAGLSGQSSQHAPQIKYACVLANGAAMRNRLKFSSYNTNLRTCTTVIWVLLI